MVPFMDSNSVADTIISILRNPAGAREVSGTSVLLVKHVAILWAQCSLRNSNMRDEDMRTEYKHANYS